MDHLVAVLRCMLAVVFLVSAVGKVRSRGAATAFAASLRDMRLMPDRVTGVVAGAVITVEFALVALMAVGWLVAGFAVAAGLLSGMTAAIVAVVRRGLRASCNCFGVASAPLGYRHVVRNALPLSAALAGLAVLVVKPDAADLPIHPAAIALCAAAGTLAALLIVRWDDLADLFLGGRAPQAQPGPARKTA